MSEIRVDNITDEAGTGSPSLPNGLVTPSATVSGDIDLGGALTNGGPAGIQIDSAGRILKPNHPAFLAVNNDSKSVSNKSRTLVTFGNVQTNVGNNYGNNMFVAPVAGNYFFTASVTYQGTFSTNRIIIYIEKNGSLIAARQMPFSGQDKGVNLSILATLSINDQIEIYTYQDSGSSRNLIDGVWTAFSGFLIG